MNLHPSHQDIEKIHTRNAEAFLLVTAALDGAIQRVYAQWAPMRTPEQLHPNVLAGDVRNMFLMYAEHPKFRRSGLLAAQGNNCSIVLSDQTGTPVRVRKHPRKPTTGALLDTAESSRIQTLFGLDFSRESWEAAVLWDPDPATQSLRAVWIAALERVDDTPAIYAKVPLSIGSPSLFGSGHRRSSDVKDGDTGFEDYFANQEGSGKEAA